ncbi:MAG: c-type cytochrome [Pseudomonadota bacterium]|jgi:cytochrome c
MKTLLASIFVAVGVLGSGAAIASADLANANCGKCHEMDKKKKGPSYKAIAAKYKGREADALKAADPKADHPEFKAKDEDVRAIVKWILAQ